MRFLWGLFIAVGLIWMSGKWLGAPRKSASSPGIPQVASPVLVPPVTPPPRRMETQGGGSPQEKPVEPFSETDPEGGADIRLRAKRDAEEKALRELQAHGEELMRQH